MEKKASKNKTTITEEAKKIVDERLDSSWEGLSLKDQNILSDQKLMLGFLCEYIQDSCGLDKASEILEKAYDFQNKSLRRLDDRLKKGSKIEIKGNPLQEI